MTRQQALVTIWQRLFVVLCVLLVICVIIFLKQAQGSIGILVFLIGNVGGYVGVHRSLAELRDEDVVGLSSSWWSIIVPSFVGGVLALVMYVLFLSNILRGDLFPKWLPDDADKWKGLEAFMNQYADGMASYAKLFFWSFVAGFNQKYVVDIIDSVKAKP